MRISFLLVDEPFYTPACLAPVVERWHASIASAAFPKGFFDAKRLRSSLALYGVAGTAGRAVRVALAGAGGGAVHRLFRARHIPTREVADVNAPAFLDELRRDGVDLVVSLNCPQKIRRPLLSLPALGCINVHFGMLPRYRGILPVFHALMNGERSFGVTVHFMDERLDNGDIIAQREVPIGPADTLDTLYPPAFRAAGELIDEAIGAFARGQVPRLPNLSADKSYYSYPTKELIRAYHVRHLR